MSRIQPWNRVWHVGLRWILSTLLMGSVWAASDFDQARKAYEQGNQEEAVAGFEGLFGALPAAWGCSITWAMPGSDRANWGGLWRPGGRQNGLLRGILRCAITWI